MAQIFAAVALESMVNFGLLLKETAKSSGQPVDTFVDYEKLKQMLRPAELVE